MLGVSGVFGVPGVFEVPGVLGVPEYSEILVYLDWCYDFQHAKIL